MQEADRIMQRGAQQMQRTADTSGRDIGSVMGNAISSKLGALGWGAMIAGTIKVAQEAKDLAEELYATGAAAERLNTGFANLAGGSTQAAAMLDKLRQASRGTIDDMNLVQSASRAMMLGVTDDADTMARLLEVAIARGRAMGISAEQAFNDIVTGIGRMSPMILDNLGILTGGQKGMEEYAASIGKTADELSELEKRQYLVNKVLQDSVTLTDDAASSAERLAAAQANLKMELGLIAAEALPDVKGAQADMIEGLAEQMRRHREAADAMIAYKDQLISMAEAGYIADEQLGTMTGTWVTLAQEVDAGRMSVEQAKLAMLSAFPEMASALQEYMDAQTEARIITELASEATLRKEQADYRAAAAADEHAAAARRLSSAIAAGYAAGIDPWLQRRVWDPGLQPETVRDQIQRDKEALRERERALEQARSQARSSATQAANEAKRLAEQQAREFQSAVESILRPTTVTGADVSATEWGAYEDKWDEYIRRLRAREDIPYYQRAEEERRFYAGLMPEQINWDAVIRDFMRKQEEEAGRQAMVQEAMRRIQEATGMAANYAAVAEAMGIPAGAVTGAQTAEALQEGIAAVDLGATVTEQFVTQMRAQRQTYVDLGVEMMQAVLEGTDEAVTPDVGKRFAKRIAPFIYDAFEAQGVTVKG